MIDVELKCLMMASGRRMFENDLRSDIPGIPGPGPPHRLLVSATPSTSRENNIFVPSTFFKNQPNHHKRKTKKAIVNAML